MIEFASGVASSLVASFLIILLSVNWSKSFRERLLDFLARSSKGGYSRRFENRKAAGTFTQQLLQEAAWVDFFGGRGNEFQQDSFRTLLGGRPQDKITCIRILLPNVESESGLMWVSRRERELATFDKAFTGGTLAKQISTSISVLMGYQRPDMVEVRMYSAPHFGRLIMTDKGLLLTAYTANRHGPDNELAFHSSESVVYRAMCRLFTELWSDSIPVGVGASTTDSSDSIGQKADEN
jgi:hypothetical protein